MMAFLAAREERRFSVRIQRLSEAQDVIILQVRWIMAVSQFKARLNDFLFENFLSGSYVFQKPRLGFPRNSFKLDQDKLPTRSQGFIN